MNNQLERANMSIVSAQEETKEIAEIQAKMFLARQFPRDINYCMDMIRAECQNKELAEQAVYEFPRGDSVVRGASIRLVECVARNWGNIISGIKELGTVGNKATVKAYCWDLQTNFFDEKVFDIEYVRVTKKAKIDLTDPRDRYEHLANFSTRRKRACMQAVIPQFVIDMAIDECNATLERNLKKEDDIEATKEKMLNAFQSLADWVTVKELEAYCNKEYDKLSMNDIVKLRKLFNAIKDGFVKPEKAFGRETEEIAKPNVQEANSLDKLNEKFGGDKK